MSNAYNLQYFFSLLYSVFILNDLGNENEVQLLVHSANLNAVDENGNSAVLLAAAEKGDDNFSHEMRNRRTTVTNV